MREREIAGDEGGKNIRDKKDRRKRERDSKRWAGVGRKGERTEDTALQLLPGAPEMMSLSSQLNPKT